MRKSTVCCHSVHFHLKTSHKKYRNSLQKFPVDTATRKEFFFHQCISQEWEKEWKIATTKNTFEVNEEENLNFHSFFFLCSWNFIMLWLAMRIGKEIIYEMKVEVNWSFLDAYSWFDCEVFWDGSYVFIFLVSKQMNLTFFREIIHWCGYVNNRISAGFLTKLCRILDQK